MTAAGPDAVPIRSLISWGLLEVDDRSARLADEDCPDLAAAFFIVAGRESLGRCPAGSD